MPERALLKSTFAVESLSNPLESHMLIHDLHSLSKETLIPRQDLNSPHQYS